MNNVLEQPGVIRQLDNITVNGVTFRHYEVADACYIHEQKFHVFSWQKGCSDAPHYKAYAYTVVDTDYDYEKLIEATDIDQQSLEGAAHEAVESVLETTLEECSFLQVVIDNY